MSEIVKRYLVHKPDLLTDDAKARSATLEVGRILKWEGGSLKLAFEGNRVDCWPGRAPGRPGEVLIDGRKPSEFSECIAFTRRARASRDGAGVSARARPKSRGWSRTGPQGHRGRREAERIRFTVTGSKTGPDGEG
jgi:hypothetical protein